MTCTDAQRPTDQGNARELIGPNTEAGKMIARLNSLTRGMRSEYGLVPPHLVDAVAKHNNMLIDAYHPENDHQIWLLEQVADAGARLDHCQFMIRAQLDDMADRANLCWDEDRARAAEEIAARLPKDPSRTASRLRETAQGCRWILARWDALGVPLLENVGWDEDQCNLAATLMGVGSDLRLSHPLLNPSASSTDQAGLMCAQADAVHTLMVDALEPLDAKERELTRLGYPLRPSKEYLRLQRAESKLRKVYNESMQAFRQARAERVVASEPITCLTPDLEPISLLAARLNGLASEPEPKPEPEAEPESDLSSESPFEGKPIMAMLAALVESIGHGSESPSPTPSPSTVPLATALPRPTAPLNRKARRAREKAARKHKAMAS
ncbi:MAG: hypothetical protein ABI353_05380 [Isosphaeraceae bacterium]